MTKSLIEAASVALLLTATTPGFGQGTATYYSTLADVQALTSSQMAALRRICIDGVRANSNEGGGCFIWRGPSAASAVATGGMAGGTVTVTRVISGHIAVGSRITGRGVTAGSVVFEQHGGNGGVGIYAEPVGTKIRSETLTFALIPNDGTIIAPTGQKDCLAGCLVKTDVQAPSLEDFGLSQFNSAAANTVAMNSAIAATTFTGSPGTFRAGSGSFHFNGPVVWPSGVYPVGNGPVSTRFLIDNCANGFEFRGHTGGIPNVVGSHPRDFQMSPSCATSVSAGGIAIAAINFDQVDEISNISIQSVLGRGHGGYGFVCSGCGHGVARKIAATGINGTGILINNSGTETCNGFSGESLDAYNNVGLGVTIECGQSTNIKVTGSAEGNGGPNGDTQINIVSGFMMDIFYHLEGCPLRSTGKYCITMGTRGGGPALAHSDIRFGLANLYIPGLAIADLKSGQNIRVIGTSVNGAGEDAGSVFYNIESYCSYCEVKMPSQGVPVINSSSTSRKID
jgi:hypothetical protein